MHTGHSSTARTQLTDMPISKSFRLLQLTDTHLLAQRDGILKGIRPFESLQSVYADAQARFPDHTGIVLTGDLVHDEAAGYSLLAELFKSSTLQVYCLAGNHDLPQAMQQTLSHAPFVLDSHVLINDWLVILLNSWQANETGGKLGNSQLQQLDALLKSHPQHHTLICMHHHPINMLSEWLDEIGLEDAEEFHACIKAHPQVRGVTWGHVHQASDCVRDGVHYMATPSTCMQFLPRSSTFAMDSQPPGYRSIELNGDGSITTEVIWVQT